MASTPWNWPLLSDTTRACILGIHAIPELTSSIRLGSPIYSGELAIINLKTPPDWGVRVDEADGLGAAVEAEGLAVVTGAEAAGD